MSNPSIGTVPCPIPGCGASCAVKRFAIRHIRDSGKRRAGGMYFDCPEHGRFGFDGRPKMQEYILEHGKIDGAPPPEEHPGQRMADPPPPPAQAASDSPRATPPAPRKPGFGFFG